jgi:hypothetical protein
LEKKSPLLFVVKSDALNPNSVTKYTSDELDFDSVSNFLKLFAKSGKFRGSKKEISQRGGKIHILTEEKYNKEKLCHRDMQENLCVIVP